MERDKSKYAKGNLILFIILMAISVSIFSYGKVWGADWRYYGKDDDGSYYYDAKSITCLSNSIVSVSEKMVFTEKGKNEVVSTFGKQFDLNGLNYSIALFQHDCMEKKYHSLEITEYSKDGKVLFQLKTENISKWENMDTGSVGEKLYKIICKQSKK